MSDHGHSVHIVPPSTYIKNLFVLMFLMFLTVFAATINFSGAGTNLTVAIIIALCKMAAIMTFFMHVKYSSGLVRVFALIAFAFMIIFFSFTFADFVSRTNHYHSTFVADPYGGTPTGAGVASH